MGASVISNRFQLKNSEASLLLLAFNEGHAMSLDQLANSMKVETADVEAPADAIFFVKCSPIFISSGGTEDALTKTCKSPKYFIRPELIPLPQLPPEYNTGDKALANLLSKKKPDGACKLVSDAVSGE